MSAFALPISPPPLTDTASQTYGTLRYRSVVSGQWSVVRRSLASLSSQQTLQHPRNLRIGVAPCSRLLRGRVAEILGIAAPQPRLIGRTKRHHQIALKLQPRPAQPPHALHQKSA